MDSTLIIAGRFTLEALAGRGGMGAVYRAVDSLSGQRVALKLLLPAANEDALRRFTREAELLASLRHPGIVAYVAHGLTERSQPYLAMEWLEGEDLSRRLARQPLSLAETLTLVRRAAEALAVAHQHGIVHRDVNPSNLWLRQGHPEEVVLLDFGLARYALTSQAMTGTGVVLGTPGYMAPEQASNLEEITPRADLFSLGCVLYECLTGRPPFTAPHFAAVLAKILFAEPAPLHTLRPELPASLQALLESLLAKEPQRRLESAQALRQALSTLEVESDMAPSPAPASRRPDSLMELEPQLASVVLASPLRPEQRDATVDTAWRRELRDSLRALLAPYGARLELLAEGSVLATLLPERGSATDQAAVAARCALTLKERWPEAAVVLATGPGLLQQQRLLGEAMDRAGQLLRQLEQLPTSYAAHVVLDEVTAGLLGPTFQVTRPQPELYLLQGEVLSVDETRQLLGRPTPCVGREQELATLDLALSICVEAPAAQAVLVVAPAGTGKSRLRHEFLRRVGLRGQEIQVLLGRGDPMSAGSAWGLLGQALRRLCEVADGELLESRHQRLSQRLSQHLPQAQSREVVEFLGELCGVPFGDEHSPRLRAARDDPRLMNAQVTRALVTFLQAECAHHPVLLVLEDLHWGDVLTVSLVDEALKALAEQPFMVLALARPEVKELLPGAWGRRMQELPLRGLSRKASTRLAREVLGPEVSQAQVERLVEQAAGNALFLEEVIRAVAEGRGEALPGTVLAMLQARLMRLELELRQVLLAASILGRSFWPGGVKALLGITSSSAVLEQHLSRLEQLEVVQRQEESRFPQEVEYRFRHALVRDAAYALVPDSYRPTGHRLAGAWLEQVGEGDPLVLAEHYQLGQQPERAIHFHTLAAEQFFERHDMQGMARCMEAAQALEPRGEALVRLRALRATAAFWLDDFAAAYEIGIAVLPELKAGSYRWCRLVGSLIMVCGHSGQREDILRLCQLLLDNEPEPEAQDAWGEALCFTCNMSSYVGLWQEKSACQERLKQAEGIMTRHGIARSWRDATLGQFVLNEQGNPWQALQLIDQAVRTFRELGSERNEVAPLAAGAVALGALGDLTGSVDRARGAMTLALKVGQQFGITYARHNLVLVLAASPQPSHQQEARALAMEWIEAQNSNRVHLGLAYGVLAQVAMREGQLAEALAHAREAGELLTPLPLFAIQVRWLLAALLLASGQVAEAREVAARALEEAAAGLGAGMSEPGLLQVLAEACLAQGDTAGAEQALRQALHWVRSRAEDIPDTAVRERFLQVPGHARILQLARQHLGEPSSGC